MIRSTSRRDLQGKIDPLSLAALAESIEPGSQARPVHQFDGGISCAVHGVDLTTPSGSTVPLVVKRFPSELLVERPGVFDRERQVLDLVTRSGIPGPRLVWSDATGEVMGTPTLVMTRLPGTPLMRIQAKHPSSDSSWVCPVVSALAQIHQTPLTEEDLSYLPVVDAGTTAADLRTMPAHDIQSRIRTLPWGKDVWGVLQSHWDLACEDPVVLVHGDFHAGWHAGSLSGVIDWADAKAGSAEYDLSHLRWETFLRYDRSVLDLAQRAYEMAVGHSMPTGPMWDLVLIWRLGDAFRSWIWFFEIEGREPITLDDLEGRRRGWIDRALSALR